MPTSYKVCPVKVFAKAVFTEKSTCLNEQPPLRDMTHVPVTTIRASYGTPGFDDFRQYTIEHDRVVKMAGRYGDMAFPEFTYTGMINGFFSENRSVMYLNGRKADVLSFCTATTRVAEIQIDTLEIDMNALQEKLPSVNLVWFRFLKGMVRASALMGANVEKTDAFMKSKVEGEISTLSFYFEDGGKQHPVMLVSDGTVVLQAQYPERADELRIVTAVHQTLFADISTRVSPKNAGRTFTVSLTPP